MAKNMMTQFFEPTKKLLGPSRNSGQIGIGRRKRVIEIAANNVPQIIQMDQFAADLNQHIITYFFFNLRVFIKE